MYCPSSCSGKGDCDWGAEDPECICDEGTVESTNCDDYDLVFTDEEPGLEDKEPKGKKPEVGSPNGSSSSGVKESLSFLTAKLLGIAVLLFCV